MAKANTIGIQEAEINVQHLSEWLNSKVDEEIIALNVRSLSGITPYDYLLYSFNISRRNDGRLRDRDLKKYQHLEHGGWWCNGVDPLNDYIQMLWGCFKPDKPRRDQQKFHKFIKYEHPYREATRVFFLQVPFKIWALVSDRCGIPVTEEDWQHPFGFWYWVWQRNVPVIIVEGAKKAGALLTNGYAAIALPGVNSGYRNNVDEFGQPTGEKQLIKDLQHFATLGRKFTICFDHDTKPETIQRVNIAITQTAKLLTACGCQVLVTQWSYPEKGIDDLIAARGRAIADEIIKLAPRLEKWQVKEYNRLSYQPALVLNQRYLGELTIPEGAKLILLKSFKGSGKTESFAPIVAEAIANGQPVILLSHRVQLAQAIADRVGIPYITEVRNSETGILLGFALCVDSLHPNGQARFNAVHWKQPLVIIDESEQVIWHLLSANTEVKKHRVEVLNQLSQLFKNAFAPGRGRIILADADLSDLSPEMVMGLAETNVTPWVVVNTWKGQSWNIYHYRQTTPISWLAALEAHIKAGGKPFIAVDAQKAKSKWGTKVLEAKLKKKFPSHKILRIDAQTIADPEHEAYGCIQRLNEILMEYDIVLASPSIGTGVSIDIKGHFTSVWGCFQGVAPENATRQALARVREEVERHLWVARHGLGKVGNGTMNVKSLLASEHRRFKANLRLLQNASLIVDGDEININRTALTIFGKMSCRINAGMIHYRESVLEALTEEGHNIIDVDDNKTRIILEKQITKQRNELYNAECENVSAADTSHLTPAKYEALQQQRSKTTTERNIERKYKLEQRYGVSVTPELVKKDDAGYYPQLRLCYYLTVGRAYVESRDRKLGEKMLQAKSAWLPDFNGGQLGLVIHALEMFNIPNFIKSDRSLRGTDEDLVQMANNALSVKWQVKTVLDITLSDSDTPIVILRRFLKKIGLKLKYKGRDGTGDRQRIYHVVGADDGRYEIFQHWLTKEKEKAAA